MHFAKLSKVCGLVLTNGISWISPPIDLLSWFQRAIQRATPEVPAYRQHLNQETNMKTPKHPKADLPINLLQAIQLAACILRRIKDKQAQKETEA